MQPLGSKLHHDHEIGRFPHLESNAALVDPVGGLCISTGSKATCSTRADDHHANDGPALVGASEYAVARPSYPVIYPGGMLGTEPPTPVNGNLSQMGEYWTSFTTTAEHCPGIYPSFSFPPQRDDYPIQPSPLRSMFYGHIEPVIGNFPHSTTPIEYSRPDSAQHNLTPLDTVASPACTMEEPP